MTLNEQERAFRASLVAMALHGKESIEVPIATLLAYAEERTALREAVVGLQPMADACFHYLGEDDGGEAEGGEQRIAAAKAALALGDAEQEVT